MSAPLSFQTIVSCSIAETNAVAGRPETFYRNAVLLCSIDAIATLNTALLIVGT